MARYQQQRKVNYPMGSVSCATMCEEDLIPTFCYELKNLARQPGILPAKVRKAHLSLVAKIEKRMESEDYFESEDAGYDLNESLFDALSEYAAPYFYFGSHPGDGTDYGFWLSESWDEDFVSAKRGYKLDNLRVKPETESIKVSDLSEVPSWFRGEVAAVNDHGNVTLYVKTSRTLREVWAIV